MSEVHRSRRALLGRLTGFGSPRDDQSASEVARHFVRHYYQEQAPRAAAELTTGALALRCLDEAAHAAQARKGEAPRVEITEERLTAGSSPGFFFLLRVTPPGGAPFERGVTLSMERDAGRWAVAALRER